MDEMDREDTGAIELILEAATGAVLRHRVGVGVDGLRERLDAPIAAGALCDPEVCARHVSQIEASEVERVEPPIELAPCFGPEGSAYQLILCPVEVPAPASKQLHPAVCPHVVGD